MTLLRPLCFLATLFLLGSCVTPPPAALFPYQENAPAPNYSGEKECLIHKDIAEYRAGQPGPFQIPRDIRGGILFDGVVVNVRGDAGGLQRVTFRPARVLQGRAGKTVTVRAPGTSRGGPAFARGQKYRVYAMGLRGVYYTWRPFAFDVRKGVPASCYEHPLYPPFYPYRHFGHHHHH